MTFGFHGKRYNAFSAWLRRRWGERVQKVCINAGFTCPNRDGSKGSGGCMFCSSSGSGTSDVPAGLDVANQVRAQINRLAARGVGKFIAYFQSFSNTHGSLSRLRELYDSALIDDRIVGLSVATRGDCVSSDTVALLREYQKRYYVWLELGLESPNQLTLDRMNRCETVGDFVRAASLGGAAGLDVVAHLIFGLPGDTAADAMRSIDLVNGVGASGVKIHNLYIDRHSQLARGWMQGQVDVLPMTQYVELACDALERLKPQVLVHRLTGEATSSNLLAPEWVRNKGAVLRAIECELQRRGSWQGAEYVRGDCGSTSQGPAG